MLQELLLPEIVCLFLDSKVTFLGWSLQILLVSWVGCRRLWVTVQFLQITWVIVLHIQPFKSHQVETPNVNRIKRDHHGE